MLLISSPIPSIRITPAPPEENHPAPFSPFPYAKLDIDDDGYRANWLSLPPPAASSPWHSSPLRPVDRHGPSHKGLSQDQFNSLLKVSRDQTVKFGSQKVPDLRKELALKSLKQLERRARFLAKVNEPSRTATISVSEVTLESSTAIPCKSESGSSVPGIAAENSEDLVVVNSFDNPGWDEQGERGLLIAEQPLASSKFPPAMQNKPRRIPPSLDEITARLKPAHASSKKDSSSSRLPNFLKAFGLSSGSMHDQIMTLPVRSLALNDEKFDTIFTRQVIHPQRPDPYNITLGSRPAVISHTVDVVAGPTLHTRRADTARDMIVTLSRRSSPPPGLGCHEYTRTSTAVKRCSAPAELQHSGRIGFDRMAASRGGL